MLADTETLICESVGRELPVDVAHFQPAKLHREEKQHSTDKSLPSGKEYTHIQWDFSGYICFDIVLTVFI